MKSTKVVYTAGPMRYGSMESEAMSLNAQVMVRDLKGINDDGMTADGQITCQHTVFQTRHDADLVKMVETLRAEASTVDYNSGSADLQVKTIKGDRYRIEKRDCWGGGKFFHGIHWPGVKYYEVVVTPEDEGRYIKV